MRFHMPSFLLLGGIACALPVCYVLPLFVFACTSPLPPSSLPRHPTAIVAGHASAALLTSPTQSYFLLLAFPILGCPLACASTPARLFLPTDVSLSSYGCHCCHHYHHYHIVSRFFNHCPAAATTTWSIFSTPAGASPPATTTTSTAVSTTR